MGHAPQSWQLHRPPEGRADASGDPLVQRLGALDLFSHAGPTDLAHLAQGARCRRLDPGDSLWFAGQSASWFAVIESGVLHHTVTLRAKPTRHSAGAI